MTPLPSRGCPSVAPPPSSVGRSGRRVVKGDGCSSPTVQAIRGAPWSATQAGTKPPHTKSRRALRRLLLLLRSYVGAGSRAVCGVEGAGPQPLPAPQIALFAPLSGAGCSTSTRPHKAKAARHQARHLNPSTGHRLSRSGCCTSTTTTAIKGTKKPRTGRGLWVVYLRAFRRSSTAASSSRS